jgi:hypothetical protein
MKDEPKAKALIHLARKRYLSMDELKEPYRQVEEYYKIIHDLLSAFMLKTGEPSIKNIKILTPSEINTIKELKAEQNKISSGEITSKEFLEPRKSIINWIIEKLLNTI